MVVGRTLYVNHAGCPIRSIAADEEATPSAPAVITEDTFQSEYSAKAATGRKDEANTSRSKVGRTCCKIVPEDA